MSRLRHLPRHFLTVPARREFATVWQVPPMASSTSPPRKPKKTAILFLGDECHCHPPCDLRRRPWTTSPCPLASRRSVGAVTALVNEMMVVLEDVREWEAYVQVTTFNALLISFVLCRRERQAYYSHHDGKKKNPEISSTVHEAPMGNAAHSARQSLE